MAGETKGITVKIDAELHAEIKEYVEKNNMTMAEFITLSADDELHPKIQQRGEEQMGSMRTLAFQVPEDLFMRVKDYLQRNNMKQREFVIGLIEKELDREQIEREKLNQQGDSDIESDADVDESEYSDADDEFDDEENSEDESEDESESEIQGITFGGM